MVTRLLRLRITGLFSLFRTSKDRAFRNGALLLLAGAAAVVSAWLPVWFAAGSGDLLAHLDIIVGSGLLVASMLFPFFLSQYCLDPRQFVQYPYSAPRVALAILVTSPASWSFIWLLLWAVSFVVSRRALIADAGITVGGIVLALLAALIFSRVASALSQLAFTSSRMIALRNALGVLLLVAALPVALFFGIQAVQANGERVLSQAAEGLLATPFGIPFSLGNAQSQTDVAETIASYGVLVAILAVLVGVWFSLAAVALTRISKPQQSVLFKQRVGWFNRLPANPPMTIGARSATYWLRDPRYRTSMIAIPVAPLLILLVLMIGGVDPAILALVPVPVVLLLLSWMVHNDIAHDSTAFWLHVASGTKGWHDRLGRLFPVFVVGVPVLLVGTSISITVFGDWRLAPSIFGLNLTVLLAGAATASLSSVIFLYPTTRPGDSPFMQPNWHGSGAGLAQTLSIGGALVLSLPVLWAVAESVADPTPGGQIGALIFASLYGGLLLSIGVFLGGAIFNRRSPELLAATQVFD